MFQPRALFGRAGVSAHLRWGNSCRRCLSAGERPSPRLCTGHYYWPAEPSTRPPPPPRGQPSSAPGPATSSSLLPPLSEQPRGGGGRGRAVLPRLGFLRQRPQQNSGGSARSERARAPPLPPSADAETWQTQALNDSAAGDCAARDAPRHCRFKHACPLFGIEPMSERPLPALSQ